MALVAAGLFARARQLLPEMLKFGIVGSIGAVFDLGGAALLHGKYNVEPLMAKGISTATAMVITYLGSRFWTFKGRENQQLRREAGLFILLNLAGLLIAEAVVGLITYVAGLHGQLAYNFASFLGTGFGTIFRYLTYRKWVFPAAKPDAAAAPGPAPRALPDYAPWELNPEWTGPGLAAPWDRVPAPTMSWSTPAPPAVAVPRGGGGRHRKR